jgi:tRNA threonylcarbamoyladenosine biosynthesis protein TsaB
MPLFICIETATQVCSVALTEGAKILAIKESGRENRHSETLHVSIGELMRTGGYQFTDLAAIAVSKGPGSYTGLRIGVSAAKGLCYALGIPLISVNTLRAMAFGATKGYTDGAAGLSLLFCPMIDARRMEVYSAVFNAGNVEVRETRAEIITPDSFSEYLEKYRMVFFGDGAAKCREMITHANAIFLGDFSPSAKYLAEIAFKKFEQKDFEDIAYFEPFYLKDFIAGIPKVKGLK